MGSLRANFRDRLASDRSKRAKIPRKLDFSASCPSFPTVCKIFEAAMENMRSLSYFLFPAVVGASAKAGVER